MITLKIAGIGKVFPNFSNDKNANAHTEICFAMLCFKGIHGLQNN
jgi:hypothetical protein